MFALQLPAFRVITLRGTNAPRGGGQTPPADAAEPLAEPLAEPVAAPAAAARHGVDPIDTGAAGRGLADPDPEGLRVVPLRPDSGWPLRRGYDRVASPFRAFPYRSLHLARMMSPADPRD